MPSNPIVVSENQKKIGLLFFMLISSHFSPNVDSSVHFVVMSIKSKLGLPTCCSKSSTSILLFSRKTGTKLSKIFALKAGFNIFLWRRQILSGIFAKKKKNHN
jgi:hypothetical protein